MKILASLVLLFGGAALACEFDTDCEVGSQCIKAAGQIYGVCVGGMDPGNSNDRAPVWRQDNTGEACQFSVDCGPGGTCAKESGQLYGVCFGGR